MDLIFYITLINQYKYQNITHKHHLNYYIYNIHQQLY